MNSAEIKQKRPLLSICSPVHNEERNLADFIEEVHAALAPHFGDDWEQILVDDGSTDASASIIAECGAKYSNVRLIKHSINLRERAAWRTAFAHARGSIIVMLASDRQNDPPDIVRLVKLITDEDYDCGTGSRENRKDDLFYWAATRGLNAFMCVAFDLSVTDVSSSFFAVRRVFIENLPLVENDHRYILALFRQRGARIKEIPTTHRARLFGQSHYSRRKVLAAMPEMARFIYRFKSGFYNPKIEEKA